jgi:sigma-E factor negative regulatory protein RseB
MTCGVRPLAALGGLLLLLLSGAATAEQRDVQTEIRGMLERMVEALRTLSYSGNLVYLHGHQLESLELVHTVRNGEELERLVSLNGAAREVLRDRQEVTCVMPDKQSISVGKRTPARSNLLPMGRLELERLDDNYLLYPLGEYRVADRPVQVLAIVPRDAYRYGYRLYLDQETGLPLKSDLMGVDASPIEQIMFTSLALTPEFDPLSETEGGREGMQRILRETPVNLAPGEDEPWLFQELPAGFSLYMHNHRQRPDGGRMDHFVLSDGLASVSVYLEPEDGQGLQGSAHVGAVNAWGESLYDRQVTVVGEVPKVTVQAVARALRHQEQRP